MELTERKIVLLGNTGYGKSSTGNTILGEEAFVTGASANSVTNKALKKGAMVNGRNITVIDTPGFGTDCDESTKSEILKALIECAPGVDAFIMVLKVGRYTRYENEVVENFLNTLKEEKVLKHTVILFTFGEQLEGQTIEEFVKESSQLQELVDKCGGRCHVIDNKHWNDSDSGVKSNRVQVENLLDTIDKMVNENGCYTNELLQMVEREIQEKMKMTVYNLTLEEKREKAKEIVYNKWRQVVGATTGFLFGALLGVGLAVAVIFILLKELNNHLQPIGVKVAGVAGAVCLSAAVAGGVGGAFTGWEAAEDAGSVFDAMTKAIKLNMKNAKHLANKAKEFLKPLQANKRKRNNF